MPRQRATDLTLPGWGDIGQMSESLADDYLSKLVSNYDPERLALKGKRIQVYNFLNKHKEEITNEDQLNVFLNNRARLKSAKAAMEIPAPYNTLAYETAIDLLERMGVAIPEDAWTPEDYHGAQKRIWKRLTLPAMRGGKTNKFFGKTIDDILQLEKPAAGSRRGKTAEWIYKYGTDVIPDIAPTGIPLSVQEYLQRFNAFDPIKTVERGKSPRVVIHTESGQSLSMGLPKQYNALPPKEEKTAEVAVA